ncbi:hypothetical protein IJJ18_02985 [Candidatus Saccharibacteria bacterium]|nr:hypothetical protein [Candidatus Saccharibacteria bacterium]
MTRVVLNNGEVDSLTDGYKSVRRYYMDRLVELTRDLGASEPLTFEQAAAEPEMPKPNDYAAVAGFRSFTDAAKEAFRKVQLERDNGGEIHEVKSPEMQIGAYSSAAAQRDGFERLKPKTVIKTFGETLRDERKSMEGEVKKVRGKTYSKEEMLAGVRRFYNVYGKLPTQKEWRTFIEGKDLPCWNTLFNRLGPKVKWPEMLGVESSESQMPSPDEFTEQILTDEKVDALQKVADAKPHEKPKKSKRTKKVEPVAVTKDGTIPVVVINQALTEFVTKVQEKVEILDAAIDVVITPTGAKGQAANPIAVHLEF